MSEQGRHTGSFGDELTNAVMIGLVVLFGVALILGAAGSVAASLRGTPQPAGDPASGVGVLFRPGDPTTALDADGLNPVDYWIVAGLLLASLVTGGLWAWVRLRRHTYRIEADPRRMAGIATRHEVTAGAAEKALLRRAGNLRPGLSDPRPQDVG